MFRFVILQFREKWNTKQGLKQIQMNIDAGFISIYERTASLHVVIAFFCEFLWNKHNISVRKTHISPNIF